MLLWYVPWEPAKKNESLVWIVVGEIVGGGCECFGQCWEWRNVNHLKQLSWSLITVLFFFF